MEKQISSFFMRILGYDYVSNRDGLETYVTNYGMGTLRRGVVIEGAFGIGEGQKALHYKVVGKEFVVYKQSGVSSPTKSFQSKKWEYSHFTSNNKLTILEILESVNSDEKGGVIGAVKKDLLRRLEDYTMTKEEKLLYKKLLNKTYRNPIKPLRIPITTKGIK